MVRQPDHYRHCRTIKSGSEDQPGHEDGFLTGQAAHRRDSQLARVYGSSNMIKPGEVGAWRNWYSIINRYGQTGLSTGAWAGFAPLSMDFDKQSISLSRLAND